MAGHTRLARRRAVYYHRATVPVDIKDSYPKTKETFALATRDYAEALRLVRLAAVEVDSRLDEHCRKTALERSAVLDDRTPAQIAVAKAAYCCHSLEEDEDIRLGGFVDLDDAGKITGGLSDAPLPTFEGHADAAHADAQAMAA